MARGWKKVYYGNYEVNRAGVVRRIKPGPGTWVGRILNPYQPSPGSDHYVSLYHDGKRRQYSIENLRKRYMMQ